MAEILKTNITPDRINLVKAFQQGVNPFGVAESAAKNMIAASEACGELESNEQVKRTKRESGPQLKEPKQGFNAKASMIETVSSIRQILGNANIEQLRSQLQQLNIQSEVLNQQGNALLNKFESDVNNLRAKEKELGVIKK